MKHKIPYLEEFFKYDKRQTFVVIVLKFVTAALFAGEAVVLAGVIDSIVDRINGLSGNVWMPCVGMVLFLLFERGVSYCYKAEYEKLKRVVSIGLSEKIIEKKSKLSYQTIENQENQERIRRIGTETADRFCKYFENVLELMKIIVIMIGLLFVVSAKSILVAGIFCMMLIPYMILSVKNGINNYDAYEDAEEEYRRAEYFKDVMSDRKYVEERTLFQYGDFINKHWAQFFQKGIQIESKANLKIFTKSEAINVLSTILIGVAALLLVADIKKGLMSIGFSIAILKSLIQYTDIISYQFANIVIQYTKGMMFFTDYKKIMELEEQNETSTARACEVEVLEFKKVSFTYPGSETPVFSEISVTFENGKQYALVGENGVGKSTLFKLLAGIYTNYTGDILINGVSIREFNFREIADMIAYVPQEINHYEITLEEYLQTSDRAKIRKVFEELGIDFIDIEKENVLLGRIEETGIELSGGQWQLLAIARAMLSEKKIYIMDEPTAAIDPIREAELYHTFRRVMKDKFAILITHRMGAAQMADEIIVMADGKVREQGTHEELMKEKGLYCDMYNAQKKWYENAK